MAADRTPAKTDEERLQRYQAVNRRYNNSEKGRARKRGYRERVAKASRRAALDRPTAETSLERLAEMCK